MKRLVTLLASVLLAAALSTSLPVIASAQSPTPIPMPGEGMGGLRAATDWLIGQQAEDGGFAGFSGASEPSITIDAIMALAAAQQQGVDVGTSIDDAVAYLESSDVAPVFAQTGPGQAAKLTLGIIAAGDDPRAFATVNPLMLVDKGVNDETGLYGTGVYDHALAMLALAAAGSDVPAEAIAALEETRTPEGGWAFDGTTTEGAADSNTTALVVQALVAAGEGDSALVSNALDYLRTTLVDDTGATFQPGDEAIADANSTALVLQAAIAAGEDPSSFDAWGNLPSALEAFQNPNGAFHYNADDPSDNLFTTAQAIPALAGLPLPLTPAPDGGAPVASPVAIRLEHRLRAA